MNTVTKPSNAFHFLIPCLLAVLSISACGGGSSEPVANITPVAFHFRMRGQPVAEDFIAIISTPETKALARAQLALPE